MEQAIGRGSVHAVPAGVADEGHLFSGSTLRPGAILRSFSPGLRKDKASIGSSALVNAAEVIHSPGATTSGLSRPSRVAPLLDVQVKPKACGASRWVEPTAMHVSACAGSVIEPRTATGLVRDADLTPTDVARVVEILPHGSAGSRYPAVYMPADW
ncbi:MAG TPA: hypothetical protein VIM26_07810 [Pengzhenrongella sp.]